MKALFALEDGRTFTCRSFTGPGEAEGEVVFNTSMTGYQEVLTDPSYRGQIVTMTYPLVGNYGINAEDIESAKIQVAGFIVREYEAFPSNFRATETLADYLRTQGVMGVLLGQAVGILDMAQQAGARGIALATKSPVAPES